MRVKIKKLRISKKDILALITTLWVILVSGIITVGSDKFLVFMVGTAGIIGYILFSGKTVYCRDKSKIASVALVFTIIVAVQFWISIFSSHIYLGSLKLLLIIGFVYLMAVNVEFDKFKYYFANIVCLIALVSICLYWFNENIISSGLFPTIKVDESTVYTNMYLYCINHSILHRNCGMFWEPGAFQIYLNIALLFIIYDPKCKLKKIKIAILSLAVLTTISTTGYVAYSLIIFSYLVQDKGRGKITILFVLVSLLLIGGRYFLPIIDESFSYKFGIGGNEMSNNVISRVNPFILDLYMIKDNPVGLCGVDYYAEVLHTYSMRYALPYISSSCTHTMIAAVFGIIPGIYFLSSFYFFAQKFTRRIYQTLILFVAFICMFATESFLMHSFYYLLIAYAQIKEKKR